MWEENIANVLRVYLITNAELCVKSHSNQNEMNYKRTHFYEFDDRLLLESVYLSVPTATLQLSDSDLWTRCNIYFCLQLYYTMLIYSQPNICK